MKDDNAKSVTHWLYQKEMRKTEGKSGPWEFQSILSYFL